MEKIFTAFLLLITQISFGQDCNTQDEVMGCDNVMTTTVTLQATRTGWTYYQVGKTGAQTISRTSF